jgi:hypothetical protein
MIISVVAMARLKPFRRQSQTVSMRRLVISGRANLALKGCISLYNQDICMFGSFGAETVFQS